MLDVSDVDELTEFDWQAVELKACLPPGMLDFFRRQGPCPVHPQSRRVNPRLYLRREAILHCSDGAQFGVYTADVSRNGVRFLAPTQFLPKTRCSLRLPTTRLLAIEIVRCRRLAALCYECGATFITRD